MDREAQSIAATTAGLTRLNYRRALIGAPPESPLGRSVHLASAAREAEASAKLPLEIVRFDPPALAFRVADGAHVQKL